MVQPVPLSKSKVIPVVAQDPEDSLYEVRQKIYPRAVSGWFARWRWAMVWITQAVFYGLCWLPWNGRQAVLFHLVERKFYFFGWVFWPQDVFYLAVILIISAYSLFLFTAVAGRLWCGYACPQTVYTEIFLWIEEKIEGDRAKRMKLDRGPLNGRKFALKSAKHGVWILLGLWTGFTFVGYFTPIRELLREVASFSLGPWETFWIFFYGFATYGNAGFLREQVCKYMCPYARFQGVMFDPDTLVITYDTARGEPRGGRSKKLDYKKAGLGDCVDCGICVQVCPTGIDIRAGLQYECIGCAACIDACDQVMDKVGYSRGLIRYTTESALEKRWGSKDILGHVLRPRVLIYGGILSAIILAFAYGLATRIPLKVNVIRDRGTLARELEGGAIENVFRFQVINTAEEPRRFRIEVSGLKDIAISSAPVVDVPAAAAKSILVDVATPSASAESGSHKILFEVKDIDHPSVFVREKASFLFP
jgi:cytochrome c oxidase accessory protein FixG